MTIGHKVFSPEQEREIDEKIRVLENLMRVAQVNRIIEEVKKEKKGTH